MAINATEKPLGKVFTPDYQLSIPSFQRAYIWKPENILQLISDLEEACKSPETPYFLGSLILVREGDTCTGKYTDTTSGKNSDCSADQNSGSDHNEHAGKT